MSGKIWHITGYIGFNDWDGPEDNNFSKNIIFDERFSKNIIIDFMTYYFSKKYRVVVINAEEVKEMVL